jgi:DNA-binding CsgD family transcriptional regulator
LTVVRPPEKLPFPPVEEFSGVAGLWFYWDREEPCVAGERELAILQLLLPAFQAGIQLAVRSVQTQNLVEDIFGNLAEGVALYDETGRVAHQSPAFRQLLSDEPEAARVQAECTRIGRLVLAYVVRQGAKSGSQESPESTEREVRTARALYRIRGALVGPHRLGPHPLAIVLLERFAPTRLSLAYLRDLYQITEREAAVSHFLADGHSNAEVAHLLGISIHTARRHVEHVLMKLGVHSRAAVGARLRELDDRRSP